jgi:hypothetical protein
MGDSPIYHQWGETVDQRTVAYSVLTGDAVGTAGGQAVTLVVAASKADIQI